MFTSEVAALSMSSFSELVAVASVFFKFIPQAGLISTVDGEGSLGRQCSAKHLPMILSQRKLFRTLKLEAQLAEFVSSSLDDLF